MTHPRKTGRITEPLTLTLDETTGRVRRNLSLDEVCRFLRLQRATVYKYTAANKIPHFKIGRKLVFPADRVAEWLTKMVKTA